MSAFSVSNSPKTQGKIDSVPNLGVTDAPLAEATSDRAKAQYSGEPVESAISGPTSSVLTPHRKEPVIRPWKVSNKIAETN